MTAAPEKPTATGPGALIADVLAGVSRLVQGEIALARAEAVARLHALRQAFVHSAVAVVFGIAATHALAAAAVVAAEASGLPLIWALLLVGSVLLALALGFARHASQLAQKAGAWPRLSPVSLKRDLETLTTMENPDVSV